MQYAPGVVGSAEGHSPARFSERKWYEFESVKENVTARQAAEMYGIRVNRNGMACCPFHDDKHPSMKVDKRFHCFSCQEDGDVIDFSAKLYELNSLGGG